jgi:hypothetical protein
MRAVAGSSTGGIVPTEPNGSQPILALLIAPRRRGQSRGKGELASVRNQLGAAAL